MYVMMKKFSIVLSLAFFLCLATVTSFAQSAAAGVSLNLKSMSCPNVQDGYERTHLEWKSHDYVPSIPEVNEMTTFWPSVGQDPSHGDCGSPDSKGNGYVELDDKIPFPVDLSMDVQAFNGYCSLGEPQIVPAIENYKGHLTFSTDFYETTYAYQVTFR